VSLHLIPHRRTNRHRGKSGRELQQELVAAEQTIAALTAGIDQITAERNAANQRADQTAVDLGTAHEEIHRLETVVRRRDQEIQQLNERITVAVKAEHVIARTQELDVSELRDRFTTGTPVRLGASPLAATNPGHVPAAGTPDSGPAAA